MKKLLFKGMLYAFLLVIILELLVRVFHLHKDYPYRFIDQYDVEKWVPNQNGYGVTGNRRQNFSQYRINNSGYNSYREFEPTKNKKELALVGDSFIEGFHQNFYNSIGKKIEKQIPNLEVYEYGYAGYDFADQLHLVSKYKSQFDLIDYIVFGVKFDNDFTRGEYRITKERMALESPKVRFLQQSKLLVYMQNIGVLNAFRNKLISIVTYAKSVGSSNSKTTLNTESNEKLNTQYLKNFESLTKIYGFDKSKSILMLDSSITPRIFIKFLKENDYQFFDINTVLSASKKPTTLIYDRHWNNYGRDLVANKIVEVLQSFQN